jgi:CubicO group peptidase (beta-lactamase class C family)
MDIEPLAEALTQYAPQVLDLCETPGLSIAVGAGGRVAWAGAFGVADLAAGRPMTIDTVGPTGSDAKPYTAVAAMQLVEAGVLGLDEPVDDHLGELRLENPHGDRPITLRDLLTHRSGLGTTVGFSDLVPPLPLGEHLARVFAAGRTDAYYGELFPLWATPVGVHHQYSNTGIAVVGHLIECANPDGATFSAWVERHIFEPLGMRSTCFPPVQDADHVPADLLARRSVGYATLPGLRFELPAIHVADYPAGTALTTPSDHVRFLLAAANDGALGGARILGSDLAREMITPQAARGIDPSMSIGLVWNLFDTGSPDEHFGHGGELMWGWHDVARAWPGHGVAVCIAANQQDLGDQGTSDRPSHLAGRLLLDVVAAWVQGEDPRPRRSEGAARSHLAGLIVADRLTGRLGIPTPLSDELVDRIAGAAIPAPGTPWDAGAFAEAIRVGRASARGGLAAGAAAWLQEIPVQERDLRARQVGVPGLATLAAVLDLLD